LCKIINIIKKAYALLDISREVGLEVNTKKTKYMFLSHHQKSGQNHNLIIANKPFENVPEFKCLGMIVTNHNCIHEEIKSRLNFQNGCYHSVQSLFVFPSPIKKPIDQTVILSGVLYGCKLSLTIKEEYGSRVFDNRC
jgi:hypothetical protein